MLTTPNYLFFLGLGKEPLLFPKPFISWVNQKFPPFNGWASFFFLVEALGGRTARVLHTFFLWGLNPPGGFFSPFFPSFWEGLFGGHSGGRIYFFWPGAFFEGGGGIILSMDVGVFFFYPEFFWGGAVFNFSLGLWFGKKFGPLL